MMPLRLTMPIRRNEPNPVSDRQAGRTDPDLWPLPPFGCLQSLSGGLIDDQQSDNGSQRGQWNVGENLQRGSPGSKALRQQQKHTNHRDASQHQQPKIGLLLCLKLATVFNVIVARQCPQSLFNGFREVFDLPDHTGQIASFDVAEHHNAPLNVFSIQRVGPGGVQDIRDFAQRNFAAGRRVQNRLLDHVGIITRGFVVPDDQSKVSVIIQNL